MFRNQWKMREQGIEGITHIDDNKPSLVEHCIEYSIPNLLKTMTVQDINAFMQGFEGFGENDESPLDYDSATADDKADAADVFEEVNQSILQEGMSPKNNQAEDKSSDARALNSEGQSDSNRIENLDRVSTSQSDGAIAKRETE